MGANALWNFQLTFNEHEWLIVMIALVCLLCAPLIRRADEKLKSRLFFSPAPAPSRGLASWSTFFVKFSHQSRPSSQRIS
jgi:hypothetical protein